MTSQYLIILLFSSFLKQSHCFEKESDLLKLLIPEETKIVRRKVASPFPEVVTNKDGPIVPLMMSNIHPLSPPQNGGNRRHVQDGHRLITRALWRIFDALMEKKSHQELYSRVALVEGLLKDMMSSEAKVKQEVDELQETIKDQENKLENLEKKIQIVEENQKFQDSLFVGIEEQKDQGNAPVDTEKNGSGISLRSLTSPMEEEYPQCSPFPFLSVGGECYYISMEIKLGWRDASKVCMQKGGGLAAPKDLPILQHALMSLPEHQRPYYAWVGGAKTADGRWVWSAGEMAGRVMDMGDATWNVEMPNDEGNCVGIYIETEYKAYSYDCSEKDYFICQF